MNQEYDASDVNLQLGRETTGPQHGASEETATRKGASRVAQEARQVGREKSRELLAEQKGGAARMFADMAAALHSSAQQLKDQAHPTTAHYIDWAADGLEDFSQSLNSRDPDALLADVRDFARRQPAVWIAGSLLAGVLIARLAKSGIEAKQSEEAEVTEPVGTEETLLH